MANYTFPTPAELRTVEQELIPSLTAADPVFDVFPMKNNDTDLLIWEKKDNWLGLMQNRGLNGRPPIVKPPGAKQFIQTPSYYGEVRAIDEIELTRRRRFGSLTATINLDDLVREAQDFLLMRQLNRIRKTCWDLLTTGVTIVLDASGVVVEEYTYTQRIYNAAVTWATSATATPLLDFRNVALQSAGYSVSFGPGAKAYMNQFTANNLFGNTNNADIYGRRTAGLGTFNSPKQVNELLTGDNLPSIVIYDRGYLDDNSVFQRFIPTGKVIVVGERISGVSLGEFRMTLNANNPNMESGPYTKVIDRGDHIVPRIIEVHRGFNGGPVMYFGSAVIVMNV
jgi:hypothetical protein